VRKKFYRRCLGSHQNPARAPRAEYDEQSGKYRCGWCGRLLKISCNVGWVLPKHNTKEKTVKKTDPADVLAAKSSSAAAKKLHKFLREWAAAHSYDPSGVALWSPERAEELGRSKLWHVAWEEGPHEWTSITVGSTLYAGHSGIYSEPGPFPEGLLGAGWYFESVNHWLVAAVPS
jgi:hypothetical protein